MRETKPNFFFLIFGLFFGGVPTIMEIVFLTKTDGAPVYFIVPFIAVFQLIGIATIVSFAIGCKKALQAKKIIKTGKTTTAKFIDGYSNVRVNGRSMYNLLFFFLDDNEKEVRIRTTASYYFHEVEFLRSLGKFEIKYLGEQAVVTEDLTKAPYTSYFDQLSSVINQTGNIQNADLQAKEEALFSVLSKELAKEKDEASMDLLLQEHIKHMSGELYQRLQSQKSYILRQRQSSSAVPPQQTAEPEPEPEPVEIKTDDIVDKRKNKWDDLYK